VRAIGHFGHIVHHPGGQDDGPGPGAQFVHDLLHGDHRPLRAEHRFLLHAGDPPQLHVAGPVGALGVNHCHIRVERGHRGQPLTSERAGDRADRRVAGQTGQALQAGPAVPAQDRERHPGGAGHVPVGHPGVAVLLQLQRAGPGVLHRVTEPVQRADARVATPREDQLARAASPDELVVDDVRGHPDEGQIAPPLPDHFAPGGERDEVCETFHGHRIAVVHGPLDGVR
jgi:hypothetical protein